MSEYSFRECLLDKGFYTPRALSGVALRDWRLRHSPPEKAAVAVPTRRKWLEQSSPAFVASAARIIAADGMAPAVKFQSESDGGMPADRGIDVPYARISRPSPYLEPDASGTQPVDQPNPDNSSRAQDDWRLNRFIDCYVAPVGPANTSGSIGGVHDEDEDVEGRLLRAHILLVLLTKFGTEEVVSHASGKQVAQAELLLGHVVEAEQALRGDSLIMTPAVLSAALKSDVNGIRLLASDRATVLTEKDGKVLKAGAAYPGGLGYLVVADRIGKAQTALRWKAYAVRALRVFQVGVDDERIDAQQTLDRASNLVAAFSGSIGGFLPILKDGLAGAVSVQKTRFYGDAYLRDARETLAVTRNATSVGANRDLTYDVPRFQSAWKLWDGELTEACTVLAAIAKKDKVACIPKAVAAASSGADAGS